MKKVSFIIVIVAILVLCCSASSTRALHTQTPIFEESDYTAAVIFLIPQNASVLKLEEPFTLDNIIWQKVQYGSYIGFVPKGYLYESAEVARYTVEHKKATSQRMGEDISIYSANSTASALVATIKDGTKLTHIVSDIDYGDFYEISYENERAFIQKQNATSGLTYNQKTAFIIGGATLFVIGAMFLLISYIKRTKRPKSE